MIPSEKAKILDENLEYEKETNSLVIGNNLEVDGYIQQNTPNYEIDLRNSLIAGGSFSTLFKSDSFYTAFKVINGILYFIWSGSAVLIDNQNTNKYFSVVIPENFKSKYYSAIKRSDGTSLAENARDTNSLWICGEVCIKNLNGAFSNMNVALVSYQNANSNILVSCYNFGKNDEDASIWFDIRIPIMLI